MNAFEEARAIEQEIIAWRRQIHQHPEIGQNLPQTAALVRQKLDEWGVEYREVIPNAFMAYIGKKGGHSILMRADMDALPMEEKTGLPFASQCPGAMHSCGHDTHTAMLLGAAKILKEHESSGGWKGKSGGSFPGWPWSRWGFPAGPITGPGSFPAANSSGWPSPGPLPPIHH